MNPIFKIGLRQQAKSGVVKAEPKERLLVTTAGGKVMVQKVRYHHKCTLLPDPVNVIVGRNVPNESVSMLEEEVAATVARACGAVDDTLAYIDASNKRIAAMEVKASKVANR